MAIFSLGPDTRRALVLVLHRTSERYVMPVDATPDAPHAHWRPKGLCSNSQGTAFASQAKKAPEAPRAGAIDTTMTLYAVVAKNSKSAKRKELHQAHVQARWKHVVANANGDGGGTDPESGDVEVRASRVARPRSSGSPGAWVVSSASHASRRWAGHTHTPLASAARVTLVLTTIAPGSSPGLPTVRRLGV
jgi:hypothetical protein